MNYVVVGMNYVVVGMNYVVVGMYSVELEKDYQPKKSKLNIVKVISETPESERQDIEELKGMVHQLTTQVNEFKQHQKQPQYSRLIWILLWLV
jgi:hypothetical protein